MEHFKKSSLSFGNLKDKSHEKSGCINSDANSKGGRGVQGYVNLQGGTKVREKNSDSSIHSFIHQHNLYFSFSHIVV